MNQEMKDKVWGKAKKIFGKLPNQYRKDPYGNVMRKSSYGKTTPMGWEIDHIIPTSRGGSDALRNLQALNAIVNRSKGNDMRKRKRHSPSNQ